MRKLLGPPLIVLCLMFASSTFVAAQDNPAGMHSPPKVLTITREFVKPGKSGMPHQKTESAFVQAMTAAKSPTHYLAMDSLSGQPRSLFLTGYDSFAAWEKDMKAVEANPTLSAALDRAYVADGELLTEITQSVWAYRDDLSLRSSVNIPQMRYFEVLRFTVKAGHEQEFEGLAKMYVAAYDKAVPDEHWAAYQSVYSSNQGPSYLVFVPMKSLAQVDEGFANEKKVMGAFGEDGMKKAADMSASSIASSESNLFMFNPKMSYVGDDWIKADPFWKPKPMAPAAKPAAKPAEKPAAQ